MMRALRIIVVAALLALAAPAARAAVSLDAVGTSFNSGGTGVLSYTYSGVTVVTGNLLVIALSYSSANTVSSVVCNGVSLTSSNSVTNGSQRVYLWTLASPAAGTQSCVISFSSYTASIVGGGMSFNGAGSVTAEAPCSGSVTAVSCGPYAVAAGGASLDIVIPAGNNFSAKGASQTLYAPSSGGLPSTTGAGSYNLGSTSMTFTWTEQFGAVAWVDAVIAIAPAPAGSAGGLSLIGVGK